MLDRQVIIRFICKSFMTKQEDIKTQIARQPQHAIKEGSLEVKMHNSSHKFGKAMW